MGPCKVLYREALQGLTGPAGWYRAVPDPPLTHGRPSYPRPPTPPLPCREGIPGPASLSGVPLLEQRAGWVVPGITTRYTHPLYPPRHRSHPTDRCRTHCRARPGTLRTCTYDRFGTVLGEPRGVRTQPRFRVPDWFILYLMFTRPFDWVSEVN